MEESKQKRAAVQIEALRRRLGVVTDEIDQDLGRALSVTRQLGLKYVDLNTLWGKNIVKLADAEVDQAAALLRENKITVGVLCTPCFKNLTLERVGGGAWQKDETLQEHFQDLARAMAIAPLLGARMVRVFSCRRPGIIGLGNPSLRLPLGGEIQRNEREKIVSILKEASDKAAEHGIKLVLENVRSCYANTGRNSAILLREVGSEHLRSLWDPGNSYVSGQYPYPDGYRDLRSFIEHVHLKNATVLDHETGLTQWEPVGEGEIDFVPQLRALVEDGFKGMAVLETHWAPEDHDREDATRYSFKTLLDVLGKASVA